MVVMKGNETPWAMKTVDGETNLELTSLIRGHRDDFIQVGPNNYFFPQSFAKNMKKYYEFEPRPTDTWIVTFPRSGTTLTQELIWMLRNKFDYEYASKVPLTKRFPFLEFNSCLSPEVRDEILDSYGGDEKKKSLFMDAAKDIIPDLVKTDQPRLIKTHLPLSLLHPNLTTCGAKIIYVARNPKDVAVSYYNLHKFFKTLDFTGSFQEFWSFFQRDLVLWGPFWTHIEEAWQLRYNPNVLFMFYEDIKNNLQESISTLADFLGTQCSPTELNTLAEHVDITKFSKNNSVNFEDLRELNLLHNNDQKFIRNGGQNSKAEFTPELEEKADEWIKRHLKRTTLRFPKQN